MPDNALLIRLGLQDVEIFDDDDQEMIIKMIDAMIVKHRVQGAVQPIDNQLVNG